MVIILKLLALITTFIRTALLRMICKGKGKDNSFDITPLTMLDSDALQPRKWQLTGTGCSTAAQPSGYP